MIHDGAGVTDPGNHPTLPDKKTPHPETRQPALKDNINEAMSGLALFIGNYLAIH